MHCKPFMNRSTCWLVWPTNVSWPPVPIPKIGTKISWLFLDYDRLLQIASYVLHILIQYLRLMPMFSTLCWKTLFWITRFTPAKDTLFDPFCAACFFFFFLYRFLTKRWNSMGHGHGTSCSWHPKINIVSAPGVCHHDFLSMGVTSGKDLSPKDWRWTFQFQSDSPSCYISQVPFTRQNMDLQQPVFNPSSRSSSPKLPHSSRISMFAPSMVPTIKPPFITNLRDR